MLQASMLKVDMMKKLRNEQKIKKSEKEESNAILLQ